ncbi:hypothetical protein Nepgr_011856 [Nepenthes gracilis]|uniref:Uncharacterized protein n=1 Tax=Nepenthes gracilis TaxID=150966 RepID=A0AAD3SFV2_NEPGR|nr:hypothetical protein Nepgr_011856 [Nepenthes gracilis]
MEDVRASARRASNNLHIPYLRLPEYHAQTTAYGPNLPAQIDFRLLASRVGNSIDRLLRSAKDFGVVRISGHGISHEELASVKAEVAQFFLKLDERKTKFRKSFVERVGNREEFVWFRSDKAIMLWAREVLGPERYQDYSYKMESIVSKLDMIAEELAEIFSKTAEKRFGKTIQEIEPIISLYRYNDTHPSLLVSTEDIHESCDHALSLHLAMERAEFYVQTDKGPLSFSTDPDAIVVTIGDQLGEWSSRDFKYVSGELIFDPNLHEMEASYSLELKCSPMNLNFGHSKKPAKKISMADQILIALIITFLYKTLLFFFQRFTGTHA